MLRYTLIDATIIIYPDFGQGIRSQETVKDNK